jgi:hypothetical protein
MLLSEKGYSRHAALRHPETMKTCSDAVILAIGASPDKVGIYLVP